VVADRQGELAALDRDRADAVLLDLPVAQGLASRYPDRYAVLAQLTGDEGLAVVLPDDSPDLEAVDALVRAAIADGSVDRLVDRWLGEDPDSIRLVRTDE
jgi:ABC-type amino acid transport substrate-binding protein